jgi:hypothetical protein
MLGTSWLRVGKSGEQVAGCYVLLLLRLSLLSDTNTERITIAADTSHDGITIAPALQVLSKSMYARF